MSDTLEHETPEQRRLRLRVEQSRHAEAELEKRRQREAAGAAEWCQKHGGRPVRRDPGPVQTATNSAYDVLAEFGLK